MRKSGPLAAGVGPGAHAALVARRPGHCTDRRGRSLYRGGRAGILPFMETRLYGKTPESTLKVYTKTFELFEEQLGYAGSQLSQYSGLNHWGSKGSLRWARIKKNCLNGRFSD